MDRVKQEMCKSVGPGGLHCPCCNKWHGKHRKQLRKIVRSRLRDKVNKVIKQELDNLKPLSE